MSLNFWYLKSFADEAYHFRKVGNVCIKITSFYQMQSCEIFQNTKKILMLCLDSKQLNVNAQCINFCKANYCTVYLQSPQFTWNRKIFSSMIMPTTLLVPLYCKNKISTWTIVWEYQWINSVMQKVHSDHNSAVMSQTRKRQNHTMSNLTYGMHHYWWETQTNCIREVLILWCKVCGIHINFTCGGGGYSAFWLTLIQVLWDVMPYWMIYSYTLHTFHLTHSSIPEDLNIH